MAVLRAFSGAESGNVALIFGLAVPLVLAGGAFAVDSASVFRQKAALQSIADAGALAGAKQLHLYQTDVATAQNIAARQVESMMAEHGWSSLPHTVQATVTTADNMVRVDITETPRTYLGSVLHQLSTINVSSEAQAYGQSKLCILGLDPSKPDTVHADKSANLNAPNCAVQSNSTDQNSLHGSGGSQINSTVICSAGGAKLDANSTFNPAATTDCAKIDDPLIDRQPPTVSGCTYTNLTIKLGAQSISPGTYCGGLKVQKGAIVTVQPGEYIISGGPLDIADGATFIGDYVSFYFADDAASLNFHPLSVISLGAEKTGALAGILFFEDRAKKPSNFQISSSLATKLLGTIYLPNSILHIDAQGSVASLSAYTVLVVSRLQVENANLVINSDYGGSDVPVPSGVGPNSSQVRLQN